MIIYIDVNEDGRVRGWGSSPITLTCIEFDLPVCHKFFYSPFSYRVIEDNLIKDEEHKLALAKKEKYKELDAECEREILGYFSATVDSIEYKFSYDEKAQSNFNSTVSLFNENLIDQVEWTVHRNDISERILLNKEQFLSVFLAAFEHRDSRVVKLRSFLFPLIDSCQSIEELRLIVW